MTRKEFNAAVRNAVRHHKIDELKASQFTEAADKNLDVAICFFDFKTLAPSYEALAELHMDELLKTTSVQQNETHQAQSGRSKLSTEELLRLAEIDHAAARNPKASQGSARSTTATRLSLSELFERNLRHN